MTNHSDLVLPTSHSLSESLSTAFFPAGQSVSKPLAKKERETAHWHFREQEIGRRIDSQFYLSTMLLPELNGIASV